MHACAMKGTKSLVLNLFYASSSHIQGRILRTIHNVEYDFLISTLFIILMSIGLQKNARVLHN